MGNGKGLRVNVKVLVLGIRRCENAWVKDTMYPYPKKVGKSKG